MNWGRLLSGLKLKLEVYDIQLASEFQSDLFEP